MLDELATPPTLRDGNVVVWFEEVGPERAKELLKTYKVDYRKHRPTYGEGLGRDMTNGYWHFDGSPVRIDDKGNLFDGQHRMHAVILSDTTQKFLFIAGLSADAYDTTDTGLARNYGDTLRRRGYQNVSQRTALIKLIERWENGKSLDDTTRRTPSELDSVMDKHIDEVNRAVAMGVSTAKKIDLPYSMVSFAWWILGNIDNEASYTFMVSVAEGENLFHGDPAYTLRERLRRDKEIKYTRNEYAHLIFQAWNAFRDGKKINKLQMPSGYVTKDKIVMPK